MNPALATFLISALPVIELRVGLPWGIAFGGLSPMTAFIWATAGTTTATILVILFLEPIANWIRRHSQPLDRLAKKIFAKTRHRHSASFDRLGAIFLLILVAVPIPGSGGYTGALVAYIFGVPTKKAILLVGTGVIISGFVMLAITTGGLEMLAFLRAEPPQLEVLGVLPPIDPVSSSVIQTLN